MQAYEIQFEARNWKPFRLQYQKNMEGISKNFLFAVLFDGCFYCRNDCWNGDLQEKQEVI